MEKVSENNDARENLIEKHWVAKRKSRLKFQSVQVVGEIKEPSGGLWEFSEGFVAALKKQFQ